MEIITRFSDRIDGIYGGCLQSIFIINNLNIAEYKEQFGKINEFIEEIKIESENYIRRRNSLYPETKSKIPKNIVKFTTTLQRLLKEIPEPFEKISDEKLQLLNNTFDKFCIFLENIMEKEF